MDRQLYYYDYVASPASAVLSSLLGGDSAVFERATAGAADEVNAFRARLHVDVAGIDVGRNISVSLGAPDDRGHGVFVPISWTAESQESLFPSMRAELEIVPLSVEPPWTQLGLLGRYHPPAGSLGAIGDALLGHRLAEAAVRRFVTELAAGLATG